MTLGRSAIMRIIRWSVAALVALVVATYIIFRSFDYVRGPAISINEPLDGTSISIDIAPNYFASTTVRGRVERAQNLLMNGKAISIDESGNFSETILVFPGINYVTMRADDQFGRTTEIQRTLVGTVLSM